MTPLKKLNRLHWLIGLCVILGVTAVGADVTLHVVQQERIDGLRSSLQQTRTTDASEFNNLLDKAETNTEQLRASGQTPAETLPQPKTVTGAPGAAGAAGATGATGTAGVSVVGAACTGSGLQMFYSDGSQENAGQCVGPPGKTGAAGPNGSNGVDGESVTGPAGPAGPVGATGPAGQDGKDGTNGTNGVSVTGVSCVLEADGTTSAFEFTFSDGTTTDVAGPCTPPTTDPTGATP